MPGRPGFRPLPVHEGILVQEVTGRSAQMNVGRDSRSREYPVKTSGDRENPVLPGDDPAIPVTGWIFLRYQREIASMTLSMICSLRPFMPYQTTMAIEAPRPMPTPHASGVMIV